MEFRKWLLENAIRTALKSPLYPPQYDCDPYDAPEMGSDAIPQFHFASGADALVWRGLKLLRFTWTKFLQTKEWNEDVD